MSDLFSIKCNKCLHEYVLGVVKSVQPPIVEHHRFCAHCGSSNVVVWEEEHLNPCAEILVGTMTATEVRERRARKSATFATLYGGAKK